MSSTDLLTTEPRCGDVALPVNPFVSNRYHFGMLLGVADLDVAQGYQRGKTWLHNAWLHGPGVVWGLRVEVRADRNEVLVHPGLALDQHGRELWVADTMCLDLGQWFADRRPDDLEVTEGDDGVVDFQVHVELCLHPCLDRPVPSISEPCDESDLDTAYSRAVERALPALVAGAAPADTEAARYPRLRQLFGQAPVTDALVGQAIAAIDAAVPADRPATCLEWFRRLAAEDTMDLAPEAGAQQWSPAAGDGCIALADIAARLRPQGDGFVVVGEGDLATTVDNRVRPSHLRTRTIQELLCRACPTDAAGLQPGETPPDAHPPDAPPSDAPTAETDPPRAVDGSATLTRRQLDLAFTRALEPASVTSDAFTVAALRNEGWAIIDVERAELAANGTDVTLQLRAAPRARPVRVVALGAGPTPLVGTNGLPLSGLDIDNITVHSGADAALMISAPGTPPPDDE